MKHISSMKALAVAVSLLFVLSSCNPFISKEKRQVNKLRSLVEKVEKNGDDFTKKKWDKAIEDFEELMGTTSAFNSDYDYTKAQMREIGELKGRFLGAAATYYVDYGMTVGTSVATEAGGVMDAFGKNFRINQETANEFAGAAGEAMQEGVHATGQVATELGKVGEAFEREVEDLDLSELDELFD